MRKFDPDVEEDNLYLGYNNNHPVFDSEELESDVGFQNALKKSEVRRPSGARPLSSCPSSGAQALSSSFRPRPLSSSFRARTFSSSSGAQELGSSFTSLTALRERLVTGTQFSSRPLSIRGAGYSSSLAFNPLSRSSGPAPLLENTPEKKIKIMEKEINDLIKESSIAHSKGSTHLALEKAIEALKMDKGLVALREMSSKQKEISLDIRHCIWLNLANQYVNNEMYKEALKTYNFILNNQLTNNPGSITVNIGYIYFMLKNYPKALGYYTKALKQTSLEYQETEIKIMQNIGKVCVCMGMYKQAINTFKQIMSKFANIKTAYNLTLCYYYTGDTKMMMKAFQELILIPLGIDDEGRYNLSSNNPTDTFIIEVIRNDKLHQMEKERKLLAEKLVMTAARLIASVMKTSSPNGLDWCVEKLKNTQYIDVANKLEITRAITFLGQDTNQAVNILKSLEREPRVASAAATNLSFIYFVEKDFDQAEHYVNLALSANCYNPAALTNKGIILFEKQNYEKAVEFFQKALRSDSMCTEAMYNLGLAFKRMHRVEEALDCFFKLHNILGNCTHVMYQLASLYEVKENHYESMEWLLRVLNITPTDPHVLAKLGELYEIEGDKSQAYQYYLQSFAILPSNIDVTAWLGNYYIETQSIDKAIHCYVLASQIQPNQASWLLLVANCYKRSGNYQKALKKYKHIHQKFPDNTECLQLLVRLCSSMKLKEGNKYATKLMKVGKIRISKQMAKSEREESLRCGKEGQESRTWTTKSVWSSSIARGDHLSLTNSSFSGSMDSYRICSSKVLGSSNVDLLDRVSRKSEATVRVCNGFKDD